MRITEVRIKLMEEGDDRLQAFCSITIDDAFVIRDLKIIDGTSGPFVAMPSRKLTMHCLYCRGKNHLRAVYCNQCGKRLPDASSRDQEGRTKLYADIAHPINSECREMIQRAVISALQEELALSMQPGYVSRYDDYVDLDEGDTPTELPAASSERRRADPPAKPLEPLSRPPNQSKKTSIQEDDEEFGAGIF